MADSSGSSAPTRSSSGDPRGPYAGYGAPRAELGARRRAFVIDTLLWVGLVQLLGAVTIEGYRVIPYGGRADTEALFDHPVWGVVAILIPVLYYAVLDGPLGQTLGKKLVRVRVVDLETDSRSVSGEPSFVRSAASFHFSCSDSATGGRSGIRSGRRGTTRSRGPWSFPPTDESEPRLQDGSDVGKRKRQPQYAEERAEGAFREQLVEAGAGEASGGATHAEQQRQQPVGTAVRP